MKQLIHPLLLTLALPVILIAGCGPTPTPPEPTAAPPTATPTPRPGTVNVWLTSADQASLLAPQPDLFFGPPGGEGGAVFYVNEHNRYQQMDGFGAAMTDSSAWLIYTQLDEIQRARVMEALFSRTGGIAVSTVRLPMGASDFVHGPAYTYDDLPAGETDPQLAHFSIEHDKAYIIPALQEALRINPDLKITASPWSMPAWMKDSGELGKGTLKPEFYDAYAAYYVKFIQAYQAEGIPIYAITPQNEPHYEPGSYPGLRLEPRDEATLVRDHLAPALAAAGLKPKILVWDHNWNEWKYPIEVLDDTTARDFIAGTAFHCYAGIVVGQDIVHQAHPDKEMHMTECSSGAWMSAGDGMKRDMKDLVIGAPRNWAKTVIMWNLALDTTFGPHTGGCNNCYGFVTIDPKSESGFTYNYDYYAIGHASKFVVPGAYRIASSSFPFQNLESVAFRNPDGSKVLVVSNNSSTDKNFTVFFGAQGFSYALTPGSSASFTWSDAQQDTAAPSAPDNPKARFNRAKALVSWDFVPSAESYNVQRAGQPGGPYTQVASGLALPEFVDPSVDTTGTYYYVVSAVNALGESPLSKEAKVAP